MQKELVLYPDKNGCVADLLSEARKQVNLTENGSGKLRLVPYVIKNIFNLLTPVQYRFLESTLFLPFRLLEVIGFKIFNVQKDDISLEHLNSAGTKLYRIEEIPPEDLQVAEDELVVPCAHFQKVSLINSIRNI